MCGFHCRCMFLGCQHRLFEMYFPQMVDHARRERLASSALGYLPTRSLYCNGAIIENSLVEAGASVNLIYVHAPLVLSANGGSLLLVIQEDLSILKKHHDKDRESRRRPRRINTACAIAVEYASDWRRLAGPEASS